MYIKGLIVAPFLACEINPRREVLFWLRAYVCACVHACASMRTCGCACMCSCTCVCV